MQCLRFFFALYFSWLNAVFASNVALEETSAETMSSPFTPRAFMAAISAAVSACALAQRRAQHT